MHKWGHLKLRNVLSDHSVSIGEDWPVVGQFSSIGSLGPKSDTWLCSEWLLSLSTTKKRGPSALHKYPSLQLVCGYDCKDYVIYSLYVHKLFFEAWRQILYTLYSRCGYIYNRCFQVWKMWETALKVTWVSVVIHPKEILKILTWLVLVVNPLAGGSIPYALQTSQKQPYLNSYLW